MIIQVRIAFHWLLPDEPKVNIYLLKFLLESNFPCLLTQIRIWNEIVHLLNKTRLGINGVMHWSSVLSEILTLDQGRVILVVSAPVQFPSLFATMTQHHWENSADWTTLTAWLALATLIFPISLMKSPVMSYSRIVPPVSPPATPTGPADRPETSLSSVDLWLGIS